MSNLLPSYTTRSLARKHKKPLWKVELDEAYHSRVYSTSAYLSSDNEFTKLSLIVLDYKYTNRNT